MIIGQLKNGIVIDHISAGKGIYIYNILGLEKLEGTVAMIKNADSTKMGKKDIIKIGEIIDLDFDLLGFIDPGITVNIIEDGKLAKITGEKQGGICYVIPYSPNGVTLEKTSAYNGVSTSSAASLHRQATVFIASGDELPKVDFSADESTLTVTIAANGATKTYTFANDSLVSPATTFTREPLDVPADVLASIEQEAGQFKS
jgi:hypothetical protein